MVRRLAVLSALLALALAPAADARVMNGDDAEPGDFPWAVALVFPDMEPELGQFCGGSLIAPDVVLTAAHCTMGSRSDEVDVFAGHVDLRDQASGQRYDVQSIRLPATAEVDPDSDAVPRRDVAVLHLDAPVANAEPIELVGADEWELWDPGAELEVMGWGRWEDPFDPYPEILQHATLDRIADEYCESLPWLGYSRDDMMCALWVHNETVRDSCNGDSGGPLTTIGTDPKDPTTGWKLVGTVSYGSAGCDSGDFPGVYARLDAPALRPFAEAFADGVDAGDPAAQLEQTGGAPVLAGTPKVGEQVTCAAGATTWSATPDELSPRIRLYYDHPWDPELFTVAVGSSYTLQSGDEGYQVLCEVHARQDGVGGYGVARSGLSAPVAAAPKTTTTTTTTTTTPPPPPDTPVAPPPQDPQPFVPEPARDLSAPRTTGVSRRCAARRCTLTIRANDLGAVVSGVAAVDVTLVSRYRCVRRGRRRTCETVRSLSATRVAAGVFRVRTPRLRRGALHRVEVFATDRAGNEEPRARVYAFRL